MGGGNADELFLGGPEHFAEDPVLAALLVGELPQIEERPEVGGGTDEEVEVVRAALQVVEAGEGKRDRDRVCAVDGRVTGLERRGHLRGPLRARDEFDLDDRGGDLGAEPARPARVRVAVARHSGGRRAGGGRRRARPDPTPRSTPSSRADHRMDRRRAADRSARAAGRA